MNILVRTDTELEIMESFLDIYRFKILTVNSGGSSTLQVDCCLSGERSREDLVVLIPGFGSGWTGISLLGYEIFKLGFSVAMISLLGYGNSSNLPNNLKNDIFSFQADILANAINQVMPFEKEKNIHWVGHSMASPIIVNLAYNYPELVRSLILLDPVGFHKRDKIGLLFSFLFNGIAHSRAFGWNEKWDILRKFLPKEKSPFLSDRLEQRFKEWRYLSSDCGSELLNRVILQKRVYCLAGDKDTLFWPINGLQYDLIPGFHNTTMFNSNETARTIIEKITSI